MTKTFNQHLNQLAKFASDINGSTNDMLNSVEVKHGEDIARRMSLLNAIMANETKVTLAMEGMMRALIQQKLDPVEITLVNLSIRALREQTNDLMDWLVQELFTDEELEELGPFITQMSNNIKRIAEAITKT